MNFGPQPVKQTSLTTLATTAAAAAGGKRNNIHTGPHFLHRHEPFFCKKKKILLIFYSSRRFSVLIFLSLLAAFLVLIIKRISSSHIHPKELVLFTPYSVPEEKSFIFDLFKIPSSPRDFRTGHKGRRWNGWNKQAICYNGTCWFQPRKNKIIIEEKGKSFISTSQGIKDDPTKHPPPSLFSLR